MWTNPLRIPAAARLTLPDSLLALWAALWIALAVAVASNASEVAKLGGTVSQTGAAVGEVGGALDAIPLLPSEVGNATESVRQAGASAEVSGRESQSAANRLAIFLGIAIAVIPSVPVFGLYLPIRLGRISESRAARRSLAEFGNDARFQEFLARRAIQHLPYATITAISEQPWDDLREGRFRALAQAELDRLDIGDTLPSARREGP